MRDLSSIKPQVDVGKGGVVREPELHKEVCDRIGECTARLDRARHRRKPDQRAGREHRVPDRGGEDLSVIPAQTGIQFSGL